MYLIRKTKELEDFCASVEKTDFITVDTEFFRENTYYPQLCLIQIATKDGARIIDALSKELDLLVLGDLLQAHTIAKVFHSAKQDLEILYQLYGKLPKNIFDTQVAASFCGFGDSVSYESLVWDITKQRIDKSYCVSDWARRPLMDKQVEYALGDVIHLRQLYLFLVDSLKENNRLAWAQEDIEALNQVDNFIVDPEQAWRKIKDMRGTKPNLVLKKLAAWREIKAKECNLPRNHYLNERHLFKLLERMPITVEELRRINHFSNVDIVTANEIINVIQESLNQQLEEDLLAQNIYPISSQKSNEIAASLKVLLANKAQEHQLPTRLIATTAEIKALSSGDKHVRPLHGWRYEIFGKFALSALA